MSSGFSLPLPMAAAQDESADATSNESFHGSAYPVSARKGRVWPASDAPSP